MRDWKRVLRVLRAQRDWDQEAAARAAGISFYRYCRIEKGVVTPAANEIAALSQAFGVRVDTVKTVRIDGGAAA